MFYRSALPVIVAICLMLLVVIPAGAATIRHIDATVIENGDMLIVADYSLDWTEEAIVYPAALPLLSGMLGKNFQVHSVTPDNVQLTVKNLVWVRQKQGTTMYETPAISLANAQKELDKLWFGDMITLDGSLGSLTIRFPDGKTVEYQDLTVIPSFKHAVASP